MLTFLVVMSVAAGLLLCGVIDVNTERLITLSQLARRLPQKRRDRPVHVSTIHRWLTPASTACGSKPFGWAVAGAPPRRHSRASRLN